jgi:hypothetical protein
MCPYCSIGPGSSTEPSFPCTCRFAQAPCPGGGGCVLGIVCRAKPAGTDQTLNVQTPPSGGFSGGETTNGTKGSVGQP